MSDNEILLGELKEFKRQTIQELQAIKKDFKAFQKQIDSLSAFRWKLSGMATLAAFLGSAAMEWFRGR